MSDTGDLINPTFEVVHTYCTSTRSSLLGNIKEERIYDPIPNVLLPHLGFKISLRASERQMQNPWISNSPFRSDSGCGSSPADQFIQSDAGRAGKSDRNETHKQTNLYIILKPG